MAMRKPRTREPRAPWTLRRRLVLAVVGLLALVSLAIGLVSVAILRASLLDGLDGRLASAADRSSAVLGGDGDGDGDHPRPTPSADVILNGPAQPPGTLALVFDGSTITAGYTNDESGEIESLTAEQVKLLGENLDQSAPVTIDLEGGLGDYRVIAQTSRTGTLYILGYPLSTVNGTAAQLAVIIGVVSLIGLLVVAVVAHCLPCSRSMGSPRRMRHALAGSAAKATLLCTSRIGRWNRQIA